MLCYKNNNNKEIYFPPTPLTSGRGGRSSHGEFSLNFCVMGIWYGDIALSHLKKLELKNGWKGKWDFFGRVKLSHSKNRDKGDEKSLGIHRGKRGSETMLNMQEYTGVIWVRNLNVRFSAAPPARVNNLSFEINKTSYLAQVHSLTLGAKFSLTP